MKIEWIDQRLLRWAAWSMRGGLVRGLWYARCTFGAMDGGGDMVSAEINEEASRTHSAVAKLSPPELRQAVHAYYTGRGTVKQRAKDLGCSEATMMRRIYHAHERLVALLHDADNPDRRRWPVQCSLAGPVDGVKG